METSGWGEEPRLNHKLVNLPLDNRELSVISSNTVTEIHINFRNRNIIYKSLTVSEHHVPLTIAHILILNYDCILNMLCKIVY